MFSAASVSARFQLGLRDMRAVFFLVIHSMPLGSQLSMQGRYWHGGRLVFLTSWGAGSALCSRPDTYRACFS